MTDITAHLTRQAAWARSTFGPGARDEGIIDHITGEFEEILEIPVSYDFFNKTEMDKYGDDYPEDGETYQRWRSQQHMKRAEEWVDNAILSLDGLLRSIWAANPNWTATHVAAYAEQMIIAKQGKNELRNWPDWRTAAPGKAIEHVKGVHD